MSLLAGAKLTGPVITAKETQSLSSQSWKKTGLKQLIVLCSKGKISYVITIQMLQISIK